MELELESDRPVAQLAARLCDVAPDGTSLLVTRGVLNLTHRDSHEHPAAARARARARAWRSQLDGIAQAIPGRPPAAARPLAGLLAVAVAGAGAGHARGAHRARARSCCRCARRAPRTSELRPFDEPEGAPPLEAGEARPGRGRAHRRRATSRRGRTELTFDWATGGRYRLVEAGLQAGCWATTTYSIVPGDPLSAEVRCQAATELGRDGWVTRAEIRAVMDADAERFRVRTELEAFENGERVRATRVELRDAARARLGRSASAARRAHAPCPGRRRSAARCG